MIVLLWSRVRLARLPFRVFRCSPLLPTQVFLLSTFRRRKISTAGKPPKPTFDAFVRLGTFDPPDVSPKKPNQTTNTTNIVIVTKKRTCGGRVAKNKIKYKIKAN